MTELTSLAKARAAIAAAKALVDDTPADRDGLLPLAADLEFARLMRAAEAHAAIALVEAVERLTHHLDYAAADNAHAANGSHR